MKVLLLTDGIYPYVMGGMQKHSYYLAKYLAKNNVKVTLFHCVDNSAEQKTNSTNNQYFEVDELKNIEFYQLPFPKLDKLPGHYIRENKAYSEAIYNKIKNYIHNYDIIYAQGFTSWSFIKNKKKGEFSLPIITNFHGLNVFQKFPSIRSAIQGNILKPLVKYLLLNSDYVVSLGGKLTQLLIDVGVSRNKILETPIGIEPLWLVSNPKRTKKNDIKSFVFIGRYDRVKGIEELNSALKNLINNNTKFEFHFIGPIPKEKQLKKPNIIYHGSITKQEKIQNIIRTCDFLVCPSHSEGMPTVILEGMASGLAIIATNVGAVKEQVVNNGWLLDNISVNDLTTALIEAYSIPEEKLIQLKLTSINLVKEKFLWEKIIEKTLKQFSEIKAL